ncbi:hypothetical protein HUU59_07420 [bacterium]|nr:hypothetical protein [bacterium]
MSGKISLLTKLAMSASLALFFFGCEMDQHYYHDDYSTDITDEEALQELFLSDYDVEDPEVWQDGSEGINAAELRGLDEEIEPLGWWRIGHRERERVSVEFIDRNHAVLTRVRSFDGSFRLLTELTDDEMETIDKPMFNDLVRKARAVRIDNSPYPRRNWRIEAITPETMESVEPNPNSVGILSMVAVDGRGDIIVELDNPLRTFFDRESLPYVYQGETVTVYVEVEGNLPAPIGMLRPNVYRGGRLPRLPLKDDGIAPDDVAGDGIYSGSYVAAQRRGVHHIGLDFIDDQTIYDDEAPYDASGWSIPYRVIAG